MKKRHYLVLSISALVLISLLYWMHREVKMNSKITSFPPCDAKKVKEKTEELKARTINAVLPQESGKTIEEIWTARALAVTREDRVARILREEFRFATAKSIPYIASLASLGLNDEQTDQLLALLIAAQHVGFDEKGKRLASLEGKSQEERDAILAGEKARIEGQIRGLVGEEAYRQHLADRAYEFPTRPYLTEFFGESYLRGQPLNATQLRAIENLPPELGADATRDALNSYPDPTMGLNWADERFIEQLTGILTPAQIAILREVHADRNFYNTTSRINKTLASNATASSGKAGP